MVTSYKNFSPKKTEIHFDTTESFLSSKKAAQNLTEERCTLRSTAYCPHRDLNPHPNESSWKKQRHFFGCEFPANDLVQFDKIFSLEWRKCCLQKNP